MATKSASRKARRATPEHPRRLTLRVTLKRIEPAIWREITVPDSYSLLQLHRCIQLVFGWLDYHRFEFQIGGRRFEAPDPEAQGEPADVVRLRDLEFSINTTFVYLYDMGDYWEHEIAVRDIVAESARDAPDSCAYLIGGARAAPPEDAGGPPGYDGILAAFARRAAGDSADIIEWLGPGFDSELFDFRAGNHALVLATAWGVI